MERTDCWNHIGVSGDGTCPELVKVVHCHNCPVYAAGGRSLLEREPPAEYLHEAHIGFQGRGIEDGVH